MVKSFLLDVFDAYFKIGGKTLFMSENLTQSSIKGGASEKEIKNGKGNALWGLLESDKTFEVTLDSNVLDFGLLATQCGTTVVTGEGTAFNPPITATIGTVKTVTLPHAPLSTSKLEVVDLAKDELMTNTQYSVSGTTLTFTSFTGEVKVLPYEYTCTSLQTITIGADKFATAGELILIGSEIDSTNKVVSEVQIYIPLAKPSSNFDLSSQSSIGDASNSVTIKALKDASGNLGYIKRIPKA